MYIYCKWSQFNLQILCLFVRLAAEKNVGLLVDVIWPY